MSRLETFGKHSNTPMTLIDNQGTIRVGENDAVGVSSPDSVSARLPILQANNTYGGYHVATTNAASGGTNRPLGSNTIFSYGFRLPKSLINDTLVNIKVSGTVLAADRDVHVSCHLGVGDAPSTTDPITLVTLPRLFSFSASDTRSYLYSDQVLLSSYSSTDHVWIWTTVSNFSSSSQGFNSYMALSAWNSNEPYPIAEDVNAP